MIGQTREHVGEPSPWIDVVKLRGFDEGVDRSRAFATGVGTGEGPFVASDRDTAQRALGGIVREAEPAVVEEARERGPSIERVGDRLGEIGLGGELRALLGEPGFELDDQGSALRLAHAAALGARLAVDGALDLEQRVDALDRIDGDRRFLQTGEIKELAPGMRLMSCSA